MSKSQGGYTLTEIIVAVAVIAILAGAMTPLIFKQIERSRDSRATQDINAFKAAFVQYYADTQFWPCGWNGARDRNQHVDIDDFSCLYEDDGQNGWDGPYLGNSAGTSPQTVAVQDGDGQWTGVVDPWGAPYASMHAGPAHGTRNTATSCCTPRAKTPAATRASAT